MRDKEATLRKDGGAEAQSHQKLHSLCSDPHTVGRDLTGLECLPEELELYAPYQALQLFGSAPER